LDRARNEEMERMGITEEMLDAARDIGQALESSMEGLQASRSSLESQQAFARKLDSLANELYERAKTALTQSKEDDARKYLLERTSVFDKLKQVLKQCEEEKRRCTQMEKNVLLLEERAMEINSLLRKSVSAKAVQQANDLGLGLRDDDPLLRKFRDQGIDF